MIPGNPVKVAIVEDQPVIRKDAEALVNKLPQFSVVGSYASKLEALEGIPICRPDLLLLDINLGDGTAFDILEKIPNNSFKVIFLTAYQEHAIKAIKCGALDYILKPINESEFNFAMYKALQNSLSENDRLVLSSKQRRQYVEIKEIIYCESNGGYTTFYLENNRTIVTSKCLKEYEDLLFRREFVRTHQSFIVNMNYVLDYYTDGYLTLKNGSEIPVATRRRDIVINTLNALTGN